MNYITNRVWSLLVCMIVLGTSAIAQPPHEDFEHHKPPSEEVQQKMKELHQAFIADKLELTDKERKEFMPLFHEMKEEEKKMMKGMKEDLKYLRKKGKKEKLSEEDANKLLDKILERDEQKLAIRKKYLNKMRKVLPATKLVKLHRADRRFRGEVMKRFKGKHKGKKHPHFAPPRD